MLRTGLWLTVLVLFALVAAGCTEPGDNGGAENDRDDEEIYEEGTLVIGAILPQSGENATYGEEAVNGLRLSGLDGFTYKGVTVDLQIHDNNSESQMTRTRVETMIQDGAELIIGAVASSNSRAGAAAASREEILMVSPASTQVALTQEIEHFTRVCYTDAVQGPVAADMAASLLKADGIEPEELRAAVLFQQGNAYSIGIAEEFRRHITEELGGTIVENVQFQRDDAEIHSQIRRIAASDPHVVFIPAYYGEVGVILRQAREDWQGSYIVGADGWDSPELFELAGGALGDLDCYITSHFVADEDRPEVIDFVDRYERAFDGARPGAMSALGYDSGLVVIDAVKRAIDDAKGVPDRHQLREAVLATQGVQGVTGEITIDPETREVTKQPILARVTEDSLTFLDLER